jgi:hypothetical protein
MIPAAPPRAEHSTRPPGGVLEDLPPPSSWTPHHRATFCALLTLALSFGYFFLTGHLDLGLADEGYLWYGVDALKAGQIPIRDFQAYDPGRYCWVAAWSFLFGDSIIALRAACVLFQCFGLFCGLLVARRISHNRAFLFVTALTMTLWMIPRYKVFEQSIALTAIYVAVRLLERPTTRQHFVTGVFIGIAAFIGRNHGLYNVIAFTLIVCTIWGGAWRELLRHSAICGAGVCVGYLPQLAMFIAVPGYGAAFMAMIRNDFSVGANLPMPVPWPWRVPPEFNWFYSATFIAEGLFYVALPGFLLLAGGLLMARGRRHALQQAPLLAAFAITFAYAHYTFSRADYIHLAHSAPAFLIGTIALTGAGRGRLTRTPPLCPVLILLGGTVTALALPSHFVPRFISGKEPFVPSSIRGQQMQLPETIATIVHIAQTMTQQLARPDESVAFLPHWPGLYPVTHRFSPFRQIYFIRPASASEESALLTTLEHEPVNWVLLQDKALDDRDDLRFRNTHPRAFRYLHEHFAPVAFPGMPPGIEMLHRRF